MRTYGSLDATTRAVIHRSLVLGTTGAVMGASFGVLAVGFGMSPLMACVMSTVVYAGASQFLALGVVTAGGSELAAIAGGLLVNSRFVPLGLAVALSMNRRGATSEPPLGLLQRAAAAHLVVDFSAALSLTQPNARMARRAFWLSGVTFLVLFVLGTSVGAFVGSALDDPDALGLDGAYPAALLALIAPALRERRPRVAALGGAGIALATTPFLPAGAPVLLAALAVAGAVLVPERHVDPSSEVGHR